MSDEQQALTLDDVKALLTGMSDAILDQVDNRFKLLQQPSDTPTPSDSKPGTDQTLSQRIKQLEDELQRRDKEKAEADRQGRYNNTFDTLLSQYELAHPDETKSILKNMFSNQVSEVDGKWLSKDGKALNELVEGFIGTPFGQHLLKAPTQQAGSGATGSNNPRVTPSESNSGLAKLFGLQ